MDSLARGATDDCVARPGPNPVTGCVKRPVFTPAIAKPGIISLSHKPSTEAFIRSERWKPGGTGTKDATVQSLEVELQRMIDEELSNAVPPNVTDPDEAISRHMEASLKLWNKLTEIRNNYKMELRKKQEERVSFENDIRAATAQTTAELAQVERELDGTNREIAVMEAQITDAENYRQKIEEETRAMEEELKAFAAQDDTLQREFNELNKAIQNVEATIQQATADYNRHKTDAERELSLAENAYSKEIEVRDQQIAVATAELEQLEHDLSEFGRNNPQEMEIMRMRDDVQRMAMENDMIRAEIQQIHQSNIELRKEGEHRLGMTQERIRQEQAAGEAEEEKMAQEIRCLEKKLRNVEDHVHHLEQQRNQLGARTTEAEAEIDRMQSDIQTTKQQLREKEKGMKEMCELIDRQESLERELEEKFEEDVRHLERNTDDKIRDIKNQILACAKKKQDNLAKIRGVCQEIKDSKERLKQAEIWAQDTFKRLKCLAEEYEALKKQNDRSEEFIAFYDAIRSHETKYVELKAALSRAKNQNEFVEVKERERRRDRDRDRSPESPRPQSARKIRNVRDNRTRLDHDRMAKYREADRVTKSPSDGCRPSNSCRDPSRRSALNDPLADPYIQAYLKVNKFKAL